MLIDSDSILRLICSILASYLIVILFILAIYDSVTGLGLD